ncbi:hypothetical protein Tco_1230675 [Tanacetum coccineum]
MTEPTMEEYVDKTRGDYYSDITKTMINEKATYELKGKFLDDLRNNAFSGTNGEDTIKHIKNFLKIVDPLNLPNFNYYLVDLTDNFFGKYYPPSCTGKTIGNKAKWDPINMVFEDWLAIKFTNHEMMDSFTKNVLWDYWKRDDGKEILNNANLSNLEKTYKVDEEEIVEIFKIEIDLFHFATPFCKAFDEFNYLLRINTDLLTSNILRFKTHDEFKNKWMNEWNKGIP